MLLQLFTTELPTPCGKHHWRNSEWFPTVTGSLQITFITMSIIHTVEEA